MLEIAHGSPGRRFQDRYRKMGEKAGAWKRAAYLVAGIVLTVVGIFFLVVPGPGIPILIVGLALLAQISATVARLLDHTEVKLRRWWKKLRS